MQQPLSKTNDIQTWRQCKQAVLTRDGRRCVLCGASKSLTLHHIRPKAIGGDSTQQNLVTVCESCHQAINRLTQWLASWLIWSYGVLMLWMARGKMRRAR